MQPRPVESGTVVDGQTRAESTASDRDQAQHQMRQACVAMDRALRSGTMARAERWLEACPAIAADEDLAVELIYSEYVAREELGPPPDPSEFLERFPQWAPHLQRLFALDGLLGSESGAGRTTQHEETTRPQAEGGVRRARRVPGFELMECLGTGGMGVVWRAWQERPRRVVALKLMRIGADAGAVERARFRREAEVVARLNHPHIVGLYEIGEVDGEPFLVFEYVSGGNLKTRLGGQPMPWRAGTELGVKLARAIAFAHGQGVVHRDLKPANVLLAGPTDGGWDQVEPKVTDFGLAAVADGLGGLTRSGQAVGTLSYMAPEQAAGGAEASAPAVDVYALGAVLYECLTGRPPVVGDSEQDLLRQVLEGEPIPAARLRPGLPRDLETIVMCCLAKQPRRRYASPLAVAEDLERFLRDEPIQARRATWKEQSWRWLRRRPAVATLLGAILVGAAALTTMAYVYTSQLRVALRDAQVQRELAATNAQEAQSALASESRRRQQARSALDALASQLVAHGRSVGRGSGDQVAMLEQALRAYEELAADVPGDPVARFGVADAWSQTARLLVALGRYAEAENAVSQAADHFRLLTEQAPGELSYRRRWISSHLDRATIRFRQKKGVEASQDIEQALKLQRALVAQFPQAEHRANLARVLVNAGSILLLTDGAAAAKAEQEAERLWEELVAEVPDDESFRFGLAQMLHNRAYRLFTEGALGGAESLMRRAQELRLTVAIEKLVLTTRMERAIGHDILAMILVAQKKPAEALAECRLAIDLLVDVVKERPNMADAYLKLSEVLLRASLQGNDLNLDAEYARCVPHLVRWLSVNDHPESAVRLGGFACNHANLVLARQQPIVALKAFDVAERALATVGEEDPRREMADKFTANTYVGRARALEMLKRFGEAVAAWDGAVRLERGPQRAIYQLERSRALVALGEIAQACAAAEAADRPEDADLFLRRAAVFALASQRASNEESLAACEAGARKWLERLQGAGRLGPNVVRYLKNHDEWEALRQRPDFKAWLAGL